MADFVKLYVVLILIPVAAIMVPAFMTWAHELDATARRMRLVEEQNKIVSFWGNWIKTVAAVVPPDEERNTRTESLIRSLSLLARHELADAGRSVMSIYRWHEYRELYDFKLDFEEFQRFRADLPWFRRAFLLYKAPNAAAKRSKFFFQVALVMITCTLIATMIRGIVPIHLRLGMPRPLLGLDAFKNIHPILAHVINWTYLVGSAFFLRHWSIRSENDRWLYVRDRVRERFGDPRHDQESGADRQAL